MRAYLPKFINYRNIGIHPNCFGRYCHLHQSNIFISKSMQRYLSTNDKIKFTFIEMKSPNVRVAVEGTEGTSVLDVALDHNIDIEGACGGQMACSTCHVILDQRLYNSLPPKSDEEQDMLDLAWGLTDTSRLCCQIKVTKELEGEIFRVPEDSNNMF